MLNNILRKFSSNHVVCLLANSQKADRIGSELMKNLRALDGSLKFIGSGGDYMKEEGLESPLYSTNLFHPKPFVPFRGTDAEEKNIWLWTKFNPITKSYTRPMHEVLKKINQEDILNKIMGYRPGVIMTLDHDILSLKIHRKLQAAYQNSQSSRPKQLHLGRFINRYEPSHLKVIDHVFYTIPIEPVNWNRFKMPSTYVGQRGFEKAYRFLLERNGGGSLVSQDSVKVSIDHFYSETEQYIESERKTFRRKFNVPEQATVLFLAPGSNSKEISWSMPILNKTANEFMQQHSEIQDNFTVVIPTNPANFEKIESIVNAQGWRGRTVLLTTEEERRSAQAGSDFAICYNGEIVSECLVNQLSTVVIENMRKLEFYFVLAWNRFNNDMNIIADGNLFPEIIEGQCHPPKLLEVLNQWYESPAHKFWPLQGFESHIHRMLPMKIREFGMGTHHEYYSPDNLLAQSVLEFVRQSPKVSFAEEKNVFIQNLKLNLN